MKKVESLCSHFYQVSGNFYSISPPTRIVNSIILIIVHSNEKLLSTVLTKMDPEHRQSLQHASVSSIVPGQVETSRYEVLVPLEDGTARLWRKVITNTYSDVVTEPR